MWIFDSYWLLFNFWDYWCLDGICYRKTKEKMTEAIALDTGHSRVGYLNKRKSLSVRIIMTQREINKKIDYYIFIDYSNDLIGYNIVEYGKLHLILLQIIKFRHYKEERHKRTYILKIKREIKNSNLTNLLLKQKISPIKDNLLIFAEVIEFIKKFDNCIIFMSVDNNQFNAFIRLLEMIPHKDHVIVRKESDLKRNSPEYQLSLIMDTMLNIERVSK